MTLRYKETTLVHLSYRWFETDPKEVLAYATRHPGKHPQLLTTLVGQWSRQEPEVAAKWAAEFASNQEMARLAAGAVSTWAEKNDLKAAEFVLKLPDGKLRQDAAVSVMSALARTDPTMGKEWIEVFPAGRGRNYAIENLVYRWAVTDPASTLVWSSHLPAAERDIALHAGAGGLIEAQLALAASWAMAIQDESRRVQQAERAARRWLKTDRGAAESWIQRSNLPPVTKLRLLAAAPSGP